MGIFKNTNKGVFGGAIKRAMSNAGDSIKDAAKKTVEKAKEVGQIAVLIPFKGLMQNSLKSVGVTPSSNLTDLAKQFFEYIVRRNSYDEVKHLTNGTGFVIDTDFDHLHGIDVTRDSLDPVTLNTIINAIVDYVKSIMDKNKRGEPMTPTQEKVADMGSKIDAQFNNLKDEEVNKSVGEIVQQYWWVAAILLVLYIKR